MRYDCEICGKPFCNMEAARQHNLAKHDGKAHIIAGNGRRVLRKQIDDAQAEIARLQAELDEANACHETALSLANFGAGHIERLQAEVERLSGANAEVVELFHDNTWNDAIEAAAHLIECDGDALRGKADAAAIRTLKRPT